MSHDHQEIDLRLMAGVTDRGLRHKQNEDAMELAVVPTADGPVLVAVVCDGVSTSARPQDASLAAAQAAARVLRAAAEAGTDLSEASAEAVRAAVEAVSGLADSPGEVGSATFISAAATRDAVTLCWVGDSRAYWLAAEPADAQQLTRDDSLAQEMVSLGLLPEEEALESPQAHVVTRWVGADPAEARPHVTRFEPPGTGVVLLCSDGLWNYQPEAPGLAGLAMPGAQTDPLGSARALVQFAIDAGGRDNITAALIPFPPGTSGSPDGLPTGSPDGPLPGSPDGPLPGSPDGPLPGSPDGPPAEPGA
jgi:serine/threonine protein phosphatase PrpC